MARSCGCGSGGCHTLKPPLEQPVLPIALRSATNVSPAAAPGASPCRTPAPCREGVATATPGGVTAAPGAGAIIVRYTYGAGSSSSIPVAMPTGRLYWVHASRRAASSFSAASSRIGAC